MVDLLSAANRLISSSLAKFLFVGGMCAVANGIFIWFATDRLHVHYLLSVAMAFLTINAAGYVLNKYFTFGRSETPLLKELGRYYRVMLGSMLFGLLAMFVLVDLAGMHYLLAAVVLTVALTLRNFLSHRDRTFR